MSEKVVLEHDDLGRTLRRIAHEIAKSDILALINDLSETRLNTWRGNRGPALAEASGVLRHLRTCFRWAVDNDLIERDPTQGVRSPIGKGERERVLTEEVLTRAFHSCFVENIDVND